jgi:hypothetical protein
LYESIKKQTNPPESGQKLNLDDVRRLEKEAALTRSEIKDGTPTGVYNIFHALNSGKGLSLFTQIESKSMLLDGF